MLIRVCGYSWDASVRNTVISSCRCKNCSRKGVITGFNSLADKRPDLAALWSDTNSKSPSEVILNSYYWATWRCPNCGGEYRSEVKYVVNNLVHCPYCADERILPGLNSFACKHSDLMNEWHYIYNYAICDPDTIGDNCRTSVWWKCSRDQSHSYTMSPSDRLMYQKRGKESCPYCKGLRRKKRHFL